MKRLTLATVSGMALFAIIFGGTPAQAHRPAAVGSFVTIDVPGARDTQAFGINDHGDVVGVYRTSALTGHGFLLRNGVLTSIDVPGATLTQASGINNRGDIVGFYSAPLQGTHPFLLRDGVFTTIKALTTLGSGANGINDRGDIVGAYVGSGSDFRVHGFLVDRRGAFSTIPDPPTGDYTTANGINARGDIVGFTGQSDFGQTGTLGFLRDRDGTFTSLDVPLNSDIEPRGINALGEIVGTYFVRGLGFTSFIRDKFGNVTTLDDAPGGFNTFAFGINARGNIVGYYGNVGVSPFHGFVLNRDNGDDGDGDQDDRDHGRGDH